ncbi:MAG: Wzz/FepE/Etk N-terminal domain-containing protein [Anaerolineae bacterium]|jgi:capsular polysaccharide biosynthesis protein|nr:Wzz/FepE/Etk N-terminal domain-containing protein [Anaerolineae bacterium]
MELREYLRIMVKYLWLIGLFPLIAVNISLNYSFARTPIYESTSSYVVGLQPFDNFGNTLYGMDTLWGNQQRVLPTYCQIITSRSVRQQAADLLNVSSNAFHVGDYQVICAVLPDTNVLRVIVQGPIPAIVTRFNEAIGLVGIREVTGIYPVFPLRRVDEAALNEVPIAPTPMQNAILAGAFGLVVALGLALLIEYLRTPSAIERMARWRRTTPLTVVSR